MRRWTLTLLGLCLTGCTREAEVAIVVTFFALAGVAASVVIAATALIVGWVRATRSSVSIAAGLLFGLAALAVPLAAGLGGSLELSPAHDDFPWTVAVCLVFGGASLAALSAAAWALTAGREPPGRFDDL